MSGFGSCAVRPGFFLVVSFAAISDMLLKTVVYI